MSLPGSTHVREGLWWALAAALLTVAVYVQWQQRIEMNRRANEAIMRGDITFRDRSLSETARPR